MPHSNPILPGYNPDPSIVRVGDDYFIATSSFEYFPGVPIYHSTDMCQWKLIGHALTRRSQIRLTGSEPGGGVWAPTLRYHDNVFYLATSSFDRFHPQKNERLYPRGFYVKTGNIWDSSSWSDPVYFDVLGFDQDIFWDIDGTVYLSTTHPKVDRSPDADASRLDFAIHVCKVDLDTGNSTSKTVMIRESPSGISEGSHIFRRGRFYYLLTAEGGTGIRHSVWAFRSEQGPLGPWESCPNNPLMNSSVEDIVQNTGHADFVEDSNGQWWATLLGVRPRRTSSGGWEESVFGRETFLVPVQWANDWPIINGGGKIQLGPELEETAGIIWKDAFSDPVLGLGWYTKNTPEKMGYSIERNPNRLSIHGGPYDLSLSASPTMFLRKQTARYCLWESKLTFCPTTEYEEAGTVVWWNHLTYSSIGIRQAGGDGRRIVYFSPTKGGAVKQELQWSNSDIILYIRCGTSYEFGFREVDESAGKNTYIQWLGEVSNESMTCMPSVGMAFAGMLLGLYAYSKYQPSLNSANFHYAKVSTV